MNRNTIITVSVVAVIIVIALIVGLGGSNEPAPLTNPDRTAFLACLDNKAIQVGYSQNQLDLTLSDNRRISLLPVTDDAGITQYRNGDISFEKKDGTIALMENGTSTFRGCVVLAEGNAVLIARIGERITGGGVAVTPLEVIEDSRCPSGAECVSAGTVRLKAKLESAAGSGDQTFTLGQGVTTEAEVVGFTAVFPLKTSTQEISTGDYQFFFSILKRATTTTTTTP